MCKELATLKSHDCNSFAGEGGGCDYWDHPCQAGAVCQGFRYGQKRQDGNGRCVFATDAIRAVLLHTPRMPGKYAMEYIGGPSEF